MSYLEALVMGMLQGLTEFLPVSSSGHLVLAAEWLGLKFEAEEQLYLTIMLHFSTAMSTLVVFRARIVGLLRVVFARGRGIEQRYLLYLLISAVPAGVVGLLLRDEIEAFFVGRTVFVGCCLLLTAVLLAWGKLRASRSARSDETERGVVPRLWIVFSMGLAQALALLPGVSRSGATIATGLALGSSRRVATEFSFLMALIPILGGTFLSVLELRNLNQATWTAISIGPMAVSAVVAFGVGYWACIRMIVWVERGKMHYFSIYCGLLGVLAIVLSL